MPQAKLIWARSAPRRCSVSGSALRARSQILAVSGITTLPLALLTNRATAHTLADLQPSDRIALPTASAPQLYLLQMQSEKVFGQYDKLRGRIAVLSHADAVSDLTGGKDSVAGYFSTAPYAEIALARQPEMAA